MNTYIMFIVTMLMVAMETVHGCQGGKRFYKRVLSLFVINCSNIANKIAQLKSFYQARKKLKDVLKIVAIVIFSPCTFIKQSKTIEIISKLGGTRTSQINTTMKYCNIKLYEMSVTNVHMKLTSVCIRVITNTANIQNVKTIKKSKRRQILFPQL